MYTYIYIYAYKQSLAFLVLASGHGTAEVMLAAVEQTYVSIPA